MVDGKNIAVVNFRKQWEEIRERLKRSGYDLSKIKITHKEKG